MYRSTNQRWLYFQKFASMISIWYFIFLWSFNDFFTVDVHGTFLRYAVFRTEITSRFIYVSLRTVAFANTVFPHAMAVQIQSCNFRFMIFFHKNFISIFFYLYFYLSFSFPASFFLAGDSRVLCTRDLPWPGEVRLTLIFLFSKRS